MNAACRAFIIKMHYFVAKSCDVGRKGSARTLTDPWSSRIEILHSLPNVPGIASLIQGVDGATSLPKSLRQSLEKRF